MDLEDTMAVALKDHNNYLAKRLGLLNYIKFLGMCNFEHLVTMKHLFCILQVFVLIFCYKVALGRLIRYWTGVLRQSTCGYF